MKCGDEEGDFWGECFEVISEICREIGSRSEWTSCCVSREEA